MDMDTRWLNLPDGLIYPPPVALHAGRGERSQVAGSGRSDHSEGQRIGFYIPSLAVGGAERVTVTIANGLAARGHDVELVISHSRGRLREDVSPDVAVNELATSRVPVAGIGAHILPLARYLRETDRTLVFAEKIDAGVVCMLAHHLVGGDTPVVPVVHSAFGVSEETTLKRRVTDLAASRLLPTADHVVAVSDGVARSVRDASAVRPNDVTVLHNPVDIESVQERARDPVNHEWVEDDRVDLVLSVGRLEPQKDHETWLRAFALVHETRPNTRAIIAGKGSQREALLELAQDLGLSEVVSIPGYVDNPYRYMDRASLFVLSSRFEGLPTVLIEALACGCPIVATDCPSGPREILENGTYGSLAPVGDARVIAERVLETLDEPPSSDVLLDRADDFAPGVVFDAYDRFIESCARPLSR